LTSKQKKKGMGEPQRQLQ